MNTMKKISVGFGTTILLAAMSQSIIADESAKTLTPAAIEQISMANKLIDLGDARKDPILLLAAAKIRKNLSDTAAAPSKESGSTKDLLERAKKYSNGRKDIAGLADDITSSKSKTYYGRDSSGSFRIIYGR